MLLGREMWSTFVLSPSHKRPAIRPACPPDSSRAKLWLRMVRTSCKTRAKWSRILPRREVRLRTRPLRPRRTSSRPRLNKVSPGTPEARSNEFVSAVYFAAGRHHAPDGGRPTCGLRRVPPIAGFRASASGLPDDSNSNFLSGRQSRRDGFFRHRAARAPVRPNPRPPANDFHEFFRQLAYHAAVQSRLEH